MAASFKVHTRLEQSDFEAIEAAAKAEGMTRSAWVKRACQARLKTTKPTPVTFEDRDDEKRTRVVVRFNAREIRAMEAAGKAMNLSRADFVKKTVRAVLHRVEKYMVLDRQMKDDIQASLAAFNRIGNMVNRIERRVNGAFNDGTLPELADHTADLLQMCETIMAEWRRLDLLVCDAFAEEYEFWRDSPSSFAAKREPIEAAEEAVQP